MEMSVIVEETPPHTHTPPTPNPEATVEQIE